MNREIASAARLLGVALVVLTLVGIAGEALQSWWVARLLRGEGSSKSGDWLGIVSQGRWLVSFVVSLAAALGALGLERSGRARLAALGLAVHALVCGVFVATSFEMFSEMGVSTVEAIHRHAWKVNLVGLLLTIVGLGWTLLAQRAAVRLPPVHGPMAAAGIAWAVLLTLIFLNFFGISPLRGDLDVGVALGVVYSLPYHLPWLLTGWVCWRHGRDAVILGKGQAPTSGVPGWAEAFDRAPLERGCWALERFATLLVLRIGLSVVVGAVTVGVALSGMVGAARALVVLSTLISLGLGVALAMAAGSYAAAALPGAGRARLAATALGVSVLVEAGLLYQVIQIMGERYGPAMRAMRRMPWFEAAALVAGLCGALAMAGVCRAVAHARSDTERLRSASGVVWLWSSVLVLGVSLRFLAASRRPSPGLMILGGVLALVLAVSAALGFVQLLRQTARDLVTG